MVSLPGIPNLTAEQLHILDTCPRAANSDDATPGGDNKGQLTRITAAAGARKTTTLLALAVKAFELGHRHITYVTFTNAVATDGKERLALQTKWPELPQSHSLAIGGRRKSH